MKRFLTLILTLCAAISGMAQETQLSLNLKKGDLYKIQAQNTSVELRDLNGIYRITKHMSSELIFKVESVNTESYSMSVWYEKLSLEETSGFSEISGLSEYLTDGNPLSAILKALTEKPFTVKMSRTGKIIAVEGIDKMMDAMFAETAEIFRERSEEDAEMLKTLIADSYGESAIKSSLKSCMVEFPDKPVSIGDSWTGDTQLQIPYGVNAARVFTFAGMNDEGRPVITSEAALATDQDEVPLKIKELDVKYDMQGAMNAETTLDPASGWIVSGTSVQRLAGAANVLECELVPDGMSMPTTVENELTVTGSVSKK